MTTHTAYNVTLDSELGEETFEYESLGEAMAGHERLVKSAGKYNDKDGIKRCVTMQIVKTITRTSF